MAQAQEQPRPRDFTTTFHEGMPPHALERLLKALCVTSSEAPQIRRSAVVALPADIANADVAQRSDARFRLRET
jgi:hypothetical protein